MALRFDEFNEMATRSIGARPRRWAAETDPPRRGLRFALHGRSWARQAAALWLGTALLAAVSPGVAADARAGALPGLNIDVAETSVSGVSSGAYMAVQFAVAHSRIVKGVGAIAGGPYDCARGSVRLAVSVCSCTTLSPFCRTDQATAEVDDLVRATQRAERAGAIDPTAQLARQRVYVFAGMLDEKVPPTLGRALAGYYGRFTRPENVRLVDQVRANHTMPTLDFGTACIESASPYLGRCGFDAAGELLQWIHGPLQPARQAPAAGFALLEFDQSPFLADPTRHGLDSTGLVFVPPRCRAGERCRLHVAFHGCRQGQSFRPLWLPWSARFGRTFAEHAGYNRWADANDIVVLYPQAVPTLANPQGCWDWWGFDDARYAVKAGRQVTAVRAMIDRLAGARR